MKYAKSIVYGGIIVSAEDPSIDETSYNRLKLVCLNCGAEIFFVQGSDRLAHQRTLKDKQGNKRTVQVKGSSIPSHFNHFNYKVTPTACENRAKQVTENTINRQATQAKGQRLKVFRNSFWRILRNSHLLMFWEEKASLGELICELIDEYHPELIVPGTDSFVQTISKYFRDNESHLEGLIDIALDLVETFFDDENRQKIQQVDPITAYSLQGLENNFEKSMQRKIATEALHYLLNNRQNPILERVLLVFISFMAELTPMKMSQEDFNKVFLSQVFINPDFEHFLATLLNVEKNITFWVKEENISNLIKVIELNLALTLCLTPWNQAFAVDQASKLPALSKTQGVSTSISNNPFSEFYQYQVVAKGLWHYRVETEILTFRSIILAANGMLKFLLPIIKQVREKNKGYFLLDTNWYCLMDFSKNDQFEFVIFENNKGDELPDYISSTSSPIETIKDLSADHQAKVLLKSCLILDINKAKEYAQSRRKELDDLGEIQFDKNKTISQAIKITNFEKTPYISSLKELNRGPIIISSLGEITITTDLTKLAQYEFHIALSAFLLIMEEIEEKITN